MLLRHSFNNDIAAALLTAGQKIVLPVPNDFMMDRMSRLSYVLATMTGITPVRVADAREHGPERDTLYPAGVAIQATHFVSRILGARPHKTTPSRGELVAQLAAKKLEIEECASRVRSEPEARKDLRRLNEELASIDEEIQILDGAERSDERQRKATFIADNAPPASGGSWNGTCCVGEAGRPLLYCRTPLRAVAEVTGFRRVEGRGKVAGQLQRSRAAGETARHSASFPDCTTWSLHSSQ